MSYDGSLPGPVPGSAQRWLPALWPGLAALLYTTFAFVPERFPDDSGRWLALLLVSELPALLIAAAHAAAQSHEGRGERVLAFLVVIAMLALVGGYPLAFDGAMLDLMPGLGWIVVSSALSLWLHDDEPKLTQARAWALLEDRGSIIALIPALVIAAVVLGIVGHLLEGLFPALSLLPSRLDLPTSYAALIGSYYFGFAALCAWHDYGPGFASTRRRFLDRKWIERLTRRPPVGYGD